MLIHQYDNATGAYIGSRLADPDPLNQDRWLMPAFTTDVALPDRPRNTWPFFIDGAWTLRPDWRGQMLYCTQTGDAKELNAPGFTPQEANLTATPRPSDEHHWVNDNWALNPEAVARRVRAEAMAEFDSLMATARQKNEGKSDAYSAGILSIGEIGLFKAWASYQMDLVKVVNSLDFPNVREWPDQPVEADVIAQAEADEAARIARNEEIARQMRAHSDAGNAPDADEAGEATKE
jgi:hypothetical protein